MYVCMYLCMYVCMYVCMYMYMYTYTYMYVCVCVYIYIYIYIYRERERGREREGYRFTTSFIQYKLSGPFRPLSVSRFAVSPFCLTLVLLQIPRFRYVYVCMYIYIYIYIYIHVIYIYIYMYIYIYIYIYMYVCMCIYIYIHIYTHLSSQCSVSRITFSVSRAALLGWPYLSNATCLMLTIDVYADTNTAAGRKFGLLAARDHARHARRQETKTFVLVK